MKNKKIWLIIAIVAVTAFILGSLLSGNDSNQTSDTEIHDHSGPEIWTCSMHPNVQLPEFGKCPLCFMDLIPLDNKPDELNPTQIKLSQAAIALAKIETSEVMSQSTGHMINLPGKVVIDKSQSNDIAARYDGRIDKLYISFPGEIIEIGQPIAMIYAPGIIALHDEMLQAKKIIENNKLGENSLVVTSATQTIGSAREKMRLYGLSANQIDELYNTDSTIEHIDLLADKNGTVLDLMVEAGNYLKTGNKLLTLANLSKLWVEFEAYDSDLSWLEKGQKVEFKIISLPGQIFSGDIIFIDSKINEVKRTTAVRVEVENKRGYLKPEMLANGVISIGSDSPEMIIPASSALITGERAVVYLEIKQSDSASIYEGREILLGSKSGEFYIVKSGLNAGDRVVTNGAFKLDSELQIQAKPSMMSSGGQTGNPHAHHAMEMPKNKIMEKVKSEQSNESESTEAISALSAVYNAYFETQMALAEDNLESSLAGYEKINRAVKNVDMALFTNEGHMKWMDFYNKLLESSQSGAKTNNFQNARIVFQKISNTIIEMHKYFGHADSADYYLTYCSMAFDNTGAYWLQQDDIIWNSYWGEKMLRCGEIKDSLKPITR